MPIPPASLIRRITAPALACLLALAALGPGLPARAQDAFYVAGPDQLPGPPGSIIRDAPMAVVPFGATARRVLYRSTGPDGASIAVSGVVIIPDQVQAGAGRPVIAWAHPTTGIVPRCAPSLAHFLYQQIAGLRTFIDRGYIVAATDYPGLGTAGPHPFLVGESEGRAVLDMARAAQALAGTAAGRQVALWGHSQGGQAVLFAAAAAPRYAPELDIAGVAAAAPATDLAQLLRDDLGTPGGDNLAAMTLWSWAQVYGAPVADVIDPPALGVMDALARICLESPIDIWPRQRLGAALTRGFLRDPGFIAREPWRGLLARNTPGLLPRTLPVFLAQGTDDATVRPPVTLAYARRLCAAGSRLAFLPLPGVGHGLAANDAVPALDAWLAGRFAGRPAPDDCDALGPR